MIGGWLVVLFRRGCYVMSRPYKGGRNITSEHLASCGKLFPAASCHKLRQHPRRLRCSLHGKAGIQVFGNLFGRAAPNLAAALGLARGGLNVSGFHA